jgi:hypothetical protein
VVLIPPDPDGRHHTWRARYADPDSGRQVKERIDPTVIRTAEARRDWAIRKSKAIAKRRIELDGGAPRVTGTALSVAIERYFDDHVHLRASTLELYRRSTKRFLDWAGRVGVKSADDVTGERLVAFRASLIKEKLHRPVEGGQKGCSA